MDKMCSRCGVTKDEGDFHRQKRRNGQWGRQSRCKECQQADARKWRKANPQKVAEAGRRKSLRARYGPDTVERYALLLELQSGRCAICGEVEDLTDSQGRAYGRLAVDHDHETGAVRGLLCRKCNRTLGWMGDNLEGVMRWVRYLESPPNDLLPEKIEVPDSWTPHHASCSECGTTVVPHGAGGLCRNCYMRKMRREGKSWAQDGRTWEERKARGALSPSRRPPKAT